MPAQLPNYNLNFTRESEFEKSFWGKVLLWVTATGKHVIIIVNFVLIAAFLSRFYFDRVLSDLNESVNVKSEIIKQNAGFEKKYIALQKKIKEIKKITTGQDRPLKIITELASLLPPGINLSNFSLKDNEVTFQANIDSDNSLKLFLSNLNSSKMVKSVEISGVEKKNIKDQVINASFQITTISI